jgi:DNA polymerase-3 subunit delta
MSNPQPQDVLGRLTLVTGPEEFLGERAIGAVRAAVRAHDAEAELSETMAVSLTMAELGDLASPSLFSTTRCIVVRGLEDLPEESAPGLLDYAASPAEDVALVLAHGGGPKGSGLLTKLRKLGTVTEVKSAPLTTREFPGFVVNELRSRQVRIAPDAADFLIQAVGQDLRSLSAAAGQLANDFEGQPLTVEMVKKYFGGRAEAKSFAVADHTLYGQAAKALEELRWALDRGTAPVLVTSAMAGGLRSLAKFMTAPRGMRNNDLMREVGVPGWKIDTLRRQSHGWDVDGVGRAIRTVARADADIKGQASDASYALEKMVLDVVRARPRAK